MFEFPEPIRNTSLGSFYDRNGSRTPHRWRMSDPPQGDPQAEEDYDNPWADLKPEPQDFNTQIVAYNASTPKTNNTNQTGYQPYQVPQQKNNGWSISLHQALQRIPFFDGNTYMLGLFCRAIREFVHAYCPRSERVIINGLASKFREKSIEGFVPRLMHHYSIDHLLADLTTQCSIVGRANRVLTEFEMMSQKTSESAADYGL